MTTASFGPSPLCERQIKKNFRPPPRAIERKGKESGEHVLVAACECGVRCRDAGCPNERCSLGGDLQVFTNRHLCKGRAVLL